MLSPLVRFATMCSLVFFTFSLNAQETKQQTHPHKIFDKGVELFEKGNFVSAQKHFQEFVQVSQSNELHLKGEAEFYYALCAIELFNQDAEYLIRSFINNYPDNQKVNLAFFELAKLRYREHKFNDAIYWFKQTNKNGLDFEQKAELLFKMGYSHFMLNELDEASRAFFEVKDTKNKYSSPATYYYSHIAYTQKNLATALKGFQKLGNDETFAPLVPYYITQIYYMQREYSKVVDYAPPILENATPKRAPEIARLIGESLYRLRRYDEAVPFIEQFVEKATSLTREDNYLVGFIYYRNGKQSEAVKFLERVATEDDTLSQNAYYHLADCYLKNDDKAKARQAFSMASKYNFDMEIKEDALFNFAKITFETLYNPFNEAIDAFHSYIELFPKSQRIDEAHSYLVLAYTSTKNYREALISLDKITNKDASIRQAYQRVAFYRGIELFQNLNFTEAIEKFTLSLKYPEYNKSLSALALYWRGESYYRIENFEQAANDYNQFLLTSGSFDQSEYKMAHYNLGYTYFKLKNYDDAIVWFRKYATQNLNNNTAYLGDAYNRIADSYFILRRYWVALDYYENAIKVNTIDVDYAILQRGIAFGLVERPQKKVESLLSLVENHQESDFMDDALFELAETYLSMGEANSAILYYDRIKEDYPGSSYFVKALVQLGIAAYNKNDSENAMSYYKRVVEEFPGSPESKNALIGIRNIYVDNGNVNDYFTYASRLGSLGNVSMAEKDSLSYIAAERIYMSGNCQKALQNLSQYIEEFPKGNFILNANYYMGDCYYKTNQFDNALTAFNQVVQKPKNPFTEQTLLAAASIYMQQSKYAEAYEMYSMLESLADLRSSLLDARLGMMRSAQKLNNHQQVVETSAKVLITEKLPNEIEIEARFSKAKALVELDRLSDAFNEFAMVSTNLKTKQGAEAKYRMAKIYFDRGEFDKAEKEIFNFAEKNTPHQYWLATSFILLADVYIAKDDFFQAKATLQSVIDGYGTTNDGIIDTASNKLTNLVKAEKEKQHGANANDTINIQWN
ncbi:MAG: tetratricopeptide repeat protein [Tenuifilaceae bacterium]|nr:tetratricopeptide repeat protein [Tenuifilaceae bacterium]